MKMETFFEKFDELVDATDVMAKMRELVLGGNSALTASKIIRLDARTLRRCTSYVPCVVPTIRSLQHEFTSAFTSPFFRNAECLLGIRRLILLGICPACPRA